MRMILTGLEQLEIKPDALQAENISENETLVDVLCCAICRTDAKMWAQGHRDLVLPRVLGHEMVVRDATNKRYVAWPGKSCGTCAYCINQRENLCDHMRITGFHMDGGFAHNAVLPKESLIPIPDALDTHIACFAEPIGCVINAFEKLTPPPKARILIYGAGTMGLIMALYAKHSGLFPLIIEKNQTKIDHVAPFLEATAVSCLKETPESEFEIVINACADQIAFCQGITKVGKGGRISFFSGLTKNAHIESNLLNLIHYKEAGLAGVYGMTRAHMEKSVPFMLTHSALLRLLIEAIVPPSKAPELMPSVLGGTRLKYILDFNLEQKKTSDTPPEPASNLERQSGNEPTPHALFQNIIQAITPLNQDLRAEALTKIDNKTKPLGALGRIEDLAVQMALIQNDLKPVIRQKQLFVFAGDHGITEEGVSAFPAEVTAQMVDNFLNGGAAINVFCRHHDIAMKVVDMGVKKEFTPHPDLVIKKIAKGTRNFALTAAMTREEAYRALESGMDVFLEAHRQHPIDILGLGEMGIGNTTSATAIIAVITGISPVQATGRGTGVDDKGLAHKTEVIQRALDFHRLDPENGIDILHKIGGFEIAGIAGAVLAAAAQKTAVVLDGVISTAAGLIAYTLNPAIKGYLIAGHKSVEQAQAAALSHMGLSPLIDFDMRLGEGTGAALAMDQANLACNVMSQMASFEEAQVAQSFIK